MSRSSNVLAHGHDFVVVFETEIAQIISEMDVKDKPLTDLPFH